MQSKDNHVCIFRKPETMNIVGSKEQEYKCKTFTHVFGYLRHGRGPIKSIPQEYRYPMDQWTEQEAKIHCHINKGIEFKAGIQSKVKIIAEKLKRALGL